MAFRNILVAVLALCSTGIASGVTYTFPDGQENGVYRAYFDDNGVEVHIKVSAHDASRDIHVPKMSRSFNKRVIWPTDTAPSCNTGNGIWINESDFYDNAYNMFWDACANDGSEKFQGMLYSVYGTARAFECCYSSNPCSTDEWSSAVAWIQAACPLQDANNMEPGYLNIPGWSKSYGYGKDGQVTC